MERRNLMKWAVSVPLVASTTQLRAADSSTFVLVHGAFHGGWCWSRVADRLRAAGHRVYTPTMTGAGERAHLMGPGVDMHTFVQDVIGVLDAEELSKVILVGHSFGGLVTTGVADRIPEKISHLVYLDAAVTTAGISLFDALPADVRAARLKAVVDVRGTNVIMPPSAEAFGIADQSDLQWVNRRLTPMPVRAYETALTLKNAPGGNLRKTYVRFTRPLLAQVDAGAQFAKSNKWDYLEIAAGHDGMVTVPDIVASTLIARV